jgi:hypothetical protein
MEPTIKQLFSFPSLSSVHFYVMRGKKQTYYKQTQLNGVGSPWDLSNLELKGPLGLERGETPPLCPGCSDSPPEILHEPPLLGRMSQLIPAINNQVVLV